MTRPGRPKLSPSTDPGPLYIDASDWAERIDFTKLFGRPAPLELEIGCGRGMFLANESTGRPEANFIGLEVAKKVAQLAAFRCHNAGASNVRVLVMDARKFLALAPNATLVAVHIYFPDPWWKRRHRKRRIVAPDVLSQLQRVLTPGGVVHLATDVEEYFRSMEKTFANFPAFSRAEPRPPRPGGHDLDYLTHFERKFRTAGKWIGRACYILTGPTPDHGNNSAEEER
jgi:tRNA (guanine-N7-)-methyltransferase